MAMTPRERWLALLDRKTPDRIPTDYQATDEVTARLRRDLGCADDEALYRKLHIDARRMVEPVWNRPPDRQPDGRHVGHRLPLGLVRLGRVPRTGSPSAGQCRQRGARSTPIAGRRATSSTTRP